MSDHNKRYFPWVIAVLAGPFLGVLLDRYGVRACMLMGAYWLYSQIDGLGDLYLVHAILGIMLLLCGLNAGVILVSNWFVERRGPAIGITLLAITQVRYPDQSDRGRATSGPVPVRA